MELSRPLLSSMANRLEMVFIHLALSSQNSAPMPMDTKDATAAVGICLQSGDSHDDPRSGSLSSSSDSGGIAEDGGRGMTLSGT